MEYGIVTKILPNRLFHPQGTYILRACWTRTIWIERLITAKIILCSTDHSSVT